MKKDIEVNQFGIKALATFGADLLTGFHEAYKRNPLSLDTEHRRGIVIGWQWTLGSIYGEKSAREIASLAGEMSGHAFPPTGVLSDDGSSYVRYDSGADYQLESRHL